METELAPLATLLGGRRRVTRPPPFSGCWLRGTKAWSCCLEPGAHGLWATFPASPRAHRGGKHSTGEGLLSSEAGPTADSGVGLQGSTEICADFPALAHPAASGASSLLAPHLPTVLRCVSLLPGAPPAALGGDPQDPAASGLLSLHGSGSWLCPQLQRSVPRLSPKPGPRATIKSGESERAGGRREPRAARVAVPAQSVRPEAARPRCVRPRP